MDFWIGYIIFAIATAMTGYIMIYKPAVDLLEEIVEEETVYGGVIGFLIYTIIATVLAPGICFLLLKNRNTEIIEGYAVSLAENILDDE